MNAYPIKFEPILKSKIWGGEKLGALLNKNTTRKDIGESWEISGVEGNISKVSNGIYKGKDLNELISEFDKQLLGGSVFEQFGGQFPLLIKFLDANTDLSVQVHPDNAMAQKYHDTFGKTEMWYIMDSDPSASIILGMNDEGAGPQILRTINADNVEGFFNRIPVTKGDSYFIPAGQIHAIGAGVLAAEIQQTSDITYRVYDWDREDANGQKRELHTEQAIEATKVFESNGKSDYSLDFRSADTVATCEYFTTNILQINDQVYRDYGNTDSFVILMCVDGCAEILVNGTSEVIKTGETVLIPAISEQVEFISNSAKFLEVFVDPLANTSVCQEEELDLLCI